MYFAKDIFSTLWWVQTLRQYCQLQIKTAAPGEGMIAPGKSQCHDGCDGDGDGDGGGEIKVPACQCFCNEKSEHAQLSTVDTL